MNKTKKKGILLLSGGIDSPVAGYLMQKQGMDLIFLHMKNDTNPKSIEKIKQLSQILDKKAKLIIENHIPIQKKIIITCNTKYQCVLCKRAMYKTAELIAKKEGAEFIITGENLGQVASQTLDNLYVLDNSIQLPVLRPLLGFEKNDIIKIAREIGTFDISKEKSACCKYVPKSPVLKAKLHSVQIYENRLFG